MDAAKVAKSNQEQAVAAWIGYLNQVRIDELLASLQRHNLDYEKAVDQINWAVSEAHQLIYDNRGGEDGLHGYLAEIAEVGISNARELILGKDANAEWLGKNDPIGPVDLIRDGVDIQVKFYQSWGLESLRAAAKHLEKYPDFLEAGGKYMIPKDQYETIKRLLEMPQDEAGKLVRGDGGPSYEDWKLVHEFFDKNDLTSESFEPSKITRSQAQRGAIDRTLDSEKDQLGETKQRLDNQALEDSKPTLAEGAKATVVAAAIEGGTAFAMAIAAKRKEGKAIRDFDENDWAEILGETGAGFGKGGVRGASVYFLTNYTATSAAVASAIVTSSFGIAEQAHRMRSGDIGEVEFIENAEMLCLDASVSALSSFIGQALIPVPVLGAVIGNTIGNVMYQAVKDGFSAREQEIIEAYAREQRELDLRLQADYSRFIDSLNIGMASYLELLDRAFDPDPVLAFQGSIVLAKELGVPSEQILDTREKAMSYFMD